MKAVAPHMIERRSGSIVITSSANGLEAGMNYAHYVSAKHGIIGRMKNIALEFAPYAIRCNSINPGAIKTPMTDHQGSRDMAAGVTIPAGAGHLILAGINPAPVR